MITVILFENVTKHVNFKVFSIQNINYLMELNIFITIPISLGADFLAFAKKLFA